MRRTRRVLSFALAAASCVHLGCTMPSPNDAEIGCTFDAQSSPQCPGYDAGGAAAPAGSDAADATDSAEAAVMGDGESGAGEASVASGLGGSCASSTSCAGQPADYCLVSPTGSFPSFCTLTHCTAAECGSSYTCCDCTASALPQLTAFPPGICVLPMTAAALPSYGCTCLPQAN
jgi:hypothetical protein